MKVHLSCFLSLLFQALPAAFLYAFVSVRQVQVSLKSEAAG